MPEGDTIHRAARTLHTALAGQRIERFESVFAHLTRVDTDTPIAGRRMERVDARGKHLLMWLEGGLVLRTHMRMHGSWHIYRPGERWQRPRHDMRIVLETAPYVAVAFMVPVAEFVAADAVEREGPVAELGPDPLGDDFDAAAALARLAARGDMEIADALLDQRAIAGIGNVFKSEILFAARVSPFAPVHALGGETLARIVAIAERQMRSNVGEATPAAGGSGRRTTNRLDPLAGANAPPKAGQLSTAPSDAEPLRWTRAERRWVYGRRGLPCRRCGTPIRRATQGLDARSTYWCERCQPTPVVEANLQVRPAGGPDRLR
jgi:endonuclease VIII